jgi:hypothetical protein
MKPTAMALALLALVLYGPGILLPALHVEKVGCRGESSILESCALRWKPGEKGGNPPQGAEMVLPHAPPRPGRTNATGENQRPNQRPPVRINGRTKAPCRLTSGEILEPPAIFRRSAASATRPSTP